MEGSTAVVEGTREETAPRPSGPPAPPPRRVTRAQARARAGRLVVGLGLVVAAVATVVATRGELGAARTSADAVAAEEAGADLARIEVEAIEAATRDQRAEADTVAATAAAAREEQRSRLRDLGLSEFTIDRFIEGYRANTELVEYRRDQTTAEVDRQALQIPELERCLVAARQAINTAFNRSIDPNVVVPTPTEVCLALLVPDS